MGLRLLLLGDGGDAFLDGAAVHVADVADLGVGQGQVAGDVGHAAAVAADDADHDFLVRARGGAQRAGIAQGGQTGGQDRALLQKIRRAIELIMLPWNRLRGAVARKLCD